ncbi:unnamed protein product [Hermetia illucens]|uniref:DUF5641 domain-containing protein n=1 Tax=Hermetia illucens TaxID=343691 RepID=A0A7R8UDB3_HERIL|nr:unnamed protein product [Hermetia illucens]
MVIIKEYNSPVRQWPLARIIRTYKGDDGKVRVTDVQTVTGVWKRPIHKLASLPTEDSFSGNEAQGVSESEEQAVPKKETDFI